MNKRFPGRVLVQFDSSYGVSVVPTFEQLPLKRDLLRGIYAYGFESPSALQKRCIKPILKGRDVIAQAPSGTGKTAGFCIPILQIVNTEERVHQALVLCPTRELAIQTQKVILGLGDYLNVQCWACMGGESLNEDARKIVAGPQVLVGTPGRVLDLLKRKLIIAKSIKVFVLDEADQLLSGGFKEEIYNIYRRLPPNIQTILTSGTFPNAVLKMTEKFMTNPVRVLVKRDELNLEGIRQFFVAVEKEVWKFDTLTDLYDILTITQAIVFVNTKAKAKWLHQKLIEHNFTVATIHSDLNQKERKCIVNEFRQSLQRILISTDVFSRGIDVHQVSLVVNYDVPNSREIYLHRIGRTGRFGRKGVAITFVKSDEMSIFRDIEQYFSIQIDEMPMNVAELI